ncbi:sphingomyelin phosphodiesterase 5 [Aplysia californica]|uniref:sphingomyelin phosphodiesterase n=1 Tax=Aplysia californica TaxID=6500 RepID=A0ABM0JRF9_APLCA|nr:sphingomyelin phosphodiesterase 5 [Aplysia californica]
MVKCAKSAPKVLVWLLHGTRWILYPSYFTFNALISLFVVTFQEEDKLLRIFLRKLILGPVYAGLFTLFLPFLIFFLPLRCFLVVLRNKTPYVLSVRHTALTDRETQYQNELIDSNDYKFGAGTANLCIMSEFLSRMNHLTDVDERSQKMGERIVVSQLFNDEWNKKVLKRKVVSQNSPGILSPADSGVVNKVNNNVHRILKKWTVEGDITTKFNRLDFIMVQEAWSSYHNKMLIDELHKVFPYVVHDVSVHGFGVNRFCLSSGLLIASRHPIIEIDFKPFKNFILHGKLLSKGLLGVKVLLGSDTSERRKVGYLFNTHFQSYQGTECVIAQQMDESIVSARQFMEQTRHDNEQVMFSIMSGDFNCDNLSPCDQGTANHELFNVYEDIARIRPGMDKPWTIGTEMRQRYMLEPAVSTPEGLKAALDDPVLRQRYVVDGDIELQSKEVLAAGLPKVDAQGNLICRQEGGRRRIDYITLHKDYPVNVEGYHFVTQLASLTDHIPVAIEFTCP